MRRTRLSLAGQIAYPPRNSRCHFDKMLIILLGFLWPAISVYCLDCYQCGNITRLSDCHNVVLCPDGMLCSLDTFNAQDNTIYNLACKPMQECSAPTTSSGAAIIGRRSSADCSACCSKDACNKLLCSGGTNFSSGQCSDDPAMDCAQVDAVFNVCQDVHRAKQVCRRFCNLCDLVDGAWSTWSTWSQCDVTCGNGTILRTRTCTNPAPANRGLNCTGPNTESRNCQLSACPVDGGWSVWMAWGRCSVSCGHGLQNRKRACTNPTPDRCGEHCSGDNVDVRMCELRACAGPTSTGGETRCKDAWIPYKGSCYFFHDGDKLDWYEAAALCQRKNAHLADIQTSNEDQFLRYWARKLFKISDPDRNHTAFWLDASDEDIEGIWKWMSIDEELTYKGWTSPDEPNSRPGNHEDCLALNGAYDFAWHDGRCPERVGYPVCEMAGAGGVPAMQIIGRK